MSPRRSLLGTVVLVAAGAAVGYLLLGLHSHVFNDEGVHAAQVDVFLRGTYAVIPQLTMIPGYHAVLALVESVTGFHDVRQLRLVTLLGSLALPVLVFRLTAMHWPQEASRRTVQWFFMPLLFPLYFLVYTDAWGLAAVLATQLCALRRRYTLAAIAGLAGTLVRQDLIIWVGVAWLLALLDGIDPARWRGEWRSRLLAGFRRAWPLLLVMLLFLAFVLWNRGIAVGERERHALTFNLTNIACFLLCAWLVFLPQNVAALPRIRALLVRPICIVLLLAGFALYMGTYSNAHPYNGEQLRYFLHNEALHWLTAYPWIRASAFVPMAWMVLTACVTDLAEPRLKVLYVIAPLAVGLHPLIEQRYYLPALTLFQVWREPLGARWENALVALYALGTIVIMWGIVSERFFP